MRNGNEAGDSGDGETFVDPRDEVIEEFLAGAPRADKWREYHDVLLARYRDAVSARDAADPDAPGFSELEKRVRELREQVRVLAEEEAVTRFVEDSVRASLTRPRPFVVPGDDEDDF